MIEATGDYGLTNLPYTKGQKNMDESDSVVIASGQVLTVSISGGTSSGISTASNQTTEIARLNSILSSVNSGTTLQLSAATNIYLIKETLNDISLTQENIFSGQTFQTSELSTKLDDISTQLSDLSSSLFNKKTIDIYEDLSSSGSTPNNCLYFSIEFLGSGGTLNDISIPNGYRREFGDKLNDISNQIPYTIPTEINGRVIIEVLYNTI
jgi:hypothetical protein